MPKLSFNDDYRLNASGVAGEELEAEHEILRSRRQQLGFTQQQVASNAKIQLRQYQRLESGERSMSGASMRVALAVCHALRLDPYRFHEVSGVQSRESI